MKFPRYFLGPMSLELVDFILENNYNVGFIPSRRQVDFNGGYVNNWTTKEFSNYIKYKSGNFLLERDHGGPNQGYVEDDGVESFIDDAKYFDIIHLDVFKKYQDIKIASEKTLEMVKMLNLENPNLLFEIGTEESICYLTPKDLNYMLDYLERNLTKEIFEKIIYVVVQCGTKLKSNKNLGIFDKTRLLEFISVCVQYGKLSKEHNGDYIPNDIKNNKFKLGLDCINIAPELGNVQTKTLLKNLNEEQIEMFYKLCYESKRWAKWVDNKFNPDQNKIELINICGHYCFSNTIVKSWIQTYKNEIYNEFKIFFDNLFSE